MPGVRKVFIWLSDSKLLISRHFTLLLRSPADSFDIGFASTGRTLQMVEETLFALDESSSKMHEPESSDARDVPLMKNDMNDPLPTTGRPLNSSDAPGKADSEMFEADEILPSLDISP